MDRLGWMGRNPSQGLEGLRNALMYLLEQRLRVPESIWRGYMEEALYDVKAEIEVLGEPQPLIRRPYSGLSAEAELLYGLARAMRRRMERLNTQWISGVDYFVSRVDRFSVRVQETYGIRFLI